MMKKLLGAGLIVATMGFFTACGTSTDEVVEHSHEMAVAEEDYDGPIDPVCGMPYEEHWELFSMYEGEEVWFCAPHCKETFDADPEKYSVNLQ